MAPTLNAAQQASPFALPARSLVSHEGTPFDLAAETRDRFTLVFFGYTYCPDVCPIAVASVSAALEELDVEEGARVRGLFVSADPERDTPERLAEWISVLGADVTALRATREDMRAVYDAIGVVEPPRDTWQQIPGGGEDAYIVPHPTAVFLVTPDGLVHFQYPFGRATPQDIASDLRTLMELDW